MLIAENLIQESEKLSYDIYENKLPSCEEANHKFKKLNKQIALKQNIRPLFKHIKFEGKPANFINKFSMISKNIFKSSKYKYKLS